jgi:hypothetical protein
MHEEKFCWIFFFSPASVFLNGGIAV